jgi:hypothetical protein
MDVFLTAPELFLTAPDVFLTAPDVFLTAPELCLGPLDERIEAPDFRIVGAGTSLGRAGRMDRGAGISLALAGIPLGAPAGERIDPPADFGGRRPISRGRRPISRGLRPISSALRLISRGLRLISSALR